MRAVSRSALSAACCVMIVAACGPGEERPNSCDHPEEMNTAPCGDTECYWALGCPATDWRLAATWQRAGAWWMEAAALECSSCDASVHVRLTLTPPPDADLDLHVWKGCGGDPVWSSTNQGLGVSEQVIVGFPDSILLPDQIMYFTIEVRPRSGPSGGQWTLAIEGTDC